MQRPISGVLQQVGLANLLWNRVEDLWYLYFTCLLPGAERQKIDAIYRSVDSGNRKRALILNVAAQSVEEGSPELIHLRALVAKTNDLAGIRNALIHGHYQLVSESGTATLRIARGGDQAKPNRLGFLPLHEELSKLLVAAKGLIAEVEGLLPRVSPPPEISSVLTTVAWVQLLDEALAAERDA
jgi:hypothetical protein